MITLGPLDSSDCERIRAWRNDPRIWRWCRQHDWISDANQDHWFKRQTADPTIKMYALMGNCRIVGVAGLTSIDAVNRRAEFSLYVGPEFHGLGYGADGLMALFDHGFHELNLHQIWGECFSGNDVALKLFKKMGMREDGIRRDFYFKNGAYTDCQLISILATEWRK